MEIPGSFAVVVKMDLVEFEGKSADVVAARGCIWKQLHSSIRKSEILNSYH